MSEFEKALDAADSAEEKAEIAAKIETQKNRKSNYQALEEQIKETGKDQISTTDTDAQSVVLNRGITQDGTKISVRPSGTEPKIKFYIEVRGTMASRADYDAADAAANLKIEAVRTSLGV